MSAILFCLFYFLLFSVIILRSKLFSIEGFSNKYVLFAFYIKLLFGLALYYIYTHIYKNRVTSDIFKYYDDAKMIFSALPNVKEYLTMLTGFGDSGAHYQAIYHTMNSWDNGYNSLLYNNSHFIIRLNAFFMLFSHGHYAVHVLFMCFMSLTGLTFIYKAFIPYLQQRHKALFAAVFLFPSVILWSSGILKEGIVWLGLGMSIYYFFQLINNTTIRFSHVIAVILGFFIIYQVKAYVLLCLLPGLVAQLLIKKNTFFNKQPVVIYAFVTALYVIPLFICSTFEGTSNPLQILSDKQADFNRVSRGGIYMANMKEPGKYALIHIADSTDIIPLNSWSDSLLHQKGIQYLAGNPFTQYETKTNHKAAFMLKGGTRFSTIQIGNKDTLHVTATDSTAYWVYIYIETAKSGIYIQPIQPNALSLISHIPQALKVSMLLPYPWQLHSAMTAIYCMENIFVLLLFFVALFFIKRPIPHKDLILFCLSYSLLMLILIGLVTPILGGIERYKSVVIPFMFILLLLITSNKRTVKS